MFSNVYVIRVGSELIMRAFTSQSAAVTYRDQYYPNGSVSGMTLDDSPAPTPVPAARKRNPCYCDSTYHPNGC